MPPNKINLTNNRDDKMRSIPLRDIKSNKYKMQLDERCLFTLLIVNTINELSTVQLG